MKRRGFIRGASAALGVLALVLAVAIIGRNGFGGAYAQQGGPNLGTGQVSSVVPLDLGCVGGPSGPNVENWEVQEGKTYRVTLTNVTECDGPTLDVTVRNSSVGNQLLTATRTAPGTYVFDVTMGPPACHTYPIVYYVGCDRSGGDFVFARRSDGKSAQSHLRAYNFGSQCSVSGGSVDGDCGGGDPGCETFTITALKFYDADASGTFTAGDTPIEKWLFQLYDANGLLMEACTNSSGQATFDLVRGTHDPGFYTVTEVLPNGSWFATSPASVEVSVSYTGPDCSAEPTFTNLCFGGGGGRTMGFWSNRNGQALITADDLEHLNSIYCLRNADGSDANFASKAAYRTWLLSANATNMAYMLSAQLSAMVLNVRHGFVSAASLVYAPGCGNTGVGNNFISIADLMAAANAALCDDGSTPAGDPNRALQECLKNALDNANNNLNFVQPQPCPFTPNCP